MAPDARRVQLEGVILTFFFAACGTSTVTDAGTDAATCSGPPPNCCLGCLNDVKAATTCTNGTWVCHGVTPEQCAGQCTTDPFCTYLPEPECVTCAGGAMTAKLCNADAGRLECPPGTVDTFVDGGVCPQDASTE